MAKIGKITDLILRLLIGSVFCLAAVLKIMDPAAFQQEILAYQMVNYPVSFIMAYWLPVFELAIGVGILFKIAYKTGLLLSLSSLVLFSVALAWTWFQGLNIDCGCFGKIDFVHGQPMALLRDLILIAVILYLCRKEVSSATGD